MHKKVPTSVSAALIVAVLVGIGWWGWTRAQPVSQSDVRPLVREIQKQNPNLPSIDPGDDLVLMGSQPKKSQKTTKKPVNDRPAAKTR